MSQLFGVALRRLRHTRGMTQDELGRAISYVEGHISNVERGRREPSLQFVSKCETVLGAAGELETIYSRERLAVSPDSPPEPASGSGCADPPRQSQALVPIVDEIRDALTNLADALLRGVAAIETGFEPSDSATGAVDDLASGTNVGQQKGLASAPKPRTSDEQVNSTGTSPRGS